MEKEIQTYPEETIRESDISRAISACGEISDRLQRSRERLIEKADHLFGPEPKDNKLQEGADAIPCGVVQTLHQRHDQILQLIDSVSEEIDRLGRL